tara:strand:- start:5294 stop:7615 length:2322 start_codon:yes stop_codon:yes gene_type:complete
MRLLGKAENLDLLKKIFIKTKLKVPIYFHFSKKNFLKDKKKIIIKVKNFSKKNKLIIRSSATNEDGKKITNAGKYTSKIVQKNSDIDDIEFFLKNYIKQFRSINDKIIVQKFVEKVNVSGVIFTKDINLDVPYYLINYDESGKTHLITSGVENDKKKQIVIYKKNIKNNKFSNLLKACNYLENFLKNDRLDIEFCIKGKITYLLQVRGLPKPKSKSKGINYSKNDFDNFLINIKKKIIKLKKINPTLSGSQTLFSNMTDWNPAEMIGEKPNPLALSMYKELITDNVWREQREKYGYQNVFPNILMFSFAGSPYIDLRTDFNSFIPSQIKINEREKILNKYLNEFKKDREIHDKIEFNLVETCYSFNSNKRLKKFFNKKILQNYLSELKKITKDILKSNLIKEEKNKVSLLSLNIKEIVEKKIGNIQKIFYLVQITKKYGTLPFAGLARCAFVSQRLLIDLKENKLISQDEFSNFFNSLNTITSNFSNDYAKLLTKKLNKDTFIKKYGHLRPSTYDINSLNYKEGFSIYFSKNSSKGNRNKTIVNFSKKKVIHKLLMKNFHISLNEFLKFAKDSILLREHAKFVFTKGIDEIFKNLIELGKEINISRNDMSFIDIKNIINYYSTLEARKLKTSMKEEIDKNKKEFEIMKMIKLPDVISSEQDIYFFEERFNKINFITSEMITGECIDLQNSKAKSLKDKIVLIKNADPGYDYIFNNRIKGLITQYGGSNSHMAIRCLELNIPASIGVGKLQYENLKKSKKILMDCNKKMLIVIK